MNVELVRQRRRAAAFLARRGDHAEALALAAEAYRAAGGEVAAELPALDDAIQPAHLDLLEELLEKAEARERAAEDPAARRRRSTLLLVAGAVVSLVALVLLLRRPAFTVEASATADAWLAARYAIDGDLKTEWALPDGKTGFIDVIPRERRHVQRVRILNSMNLPGADRGARAIRVELFADGRVVKTVDDAFPAFTREPSWRVVEVSVGNVERVRVHVDSYFGSGGGLAEIVVE